METLKRSFFVVLLIALVGAGGRAADNGLGRTPYMGWSSWSLEATKYPGYGGEDWLTAAHVKVQSDVLHQTLQKHGYTYVNMDSGWQGGYDAFGRPTPDPKKFPQGIADVARYVHHNRQKLGIYWIPGINGDLYDRNPPILGTPYHIRDIVFQPTRVATGWGFGDKIDYAKPGAQAYINSVAAQFAAWGIDFLKLDGVTPGSDRNDGSIDARPDVAAWSTALKRMGRPIWLELSWAIDRDFIGFWRQYANGWRITDDVDTYGPTLVGWSSIARCFGTLPAWLPNAGPSQGWNDLDSLNIGSGPMDGLTDSERQTTMTLWAVSCAPLYTGDDLTKLDAHGLQLLTNDEVIAVDRAGHPASPVSAGPQQVWHAHNPDGSETVALFNLDDHNSATLIARWKDIGLAGPATVRDLWSHTDLGDFHDIFRATLSPHAARLLKITPQRSR